MSDKQLTTAEDYLKRAIAWDNDHPDEAIADCNEAIRLDPQYAVAYLERGKRHNRKSEKEQALVDCERVLELDPKSAEAYLLRARIRYFKNDHTYDVDGALADCDKAISLDPNLVEAYLERGYLRDFGEGDIDGAIADYTEAIHRNPQSVDAYMDRALVYWFDKDNYDGAISDYTEAIALLIDTDPHYAAYAYQERGLVRGYKEDYAGAIADYDEAIRLDPTATDSIIGRGNARRGLGDFVGAFADYDQALRINPQSSNTYYWRGYTFDEMGDLDNAIAEYTKSLEILPNVDAYNERSWSKYLKGDYRGAVEDAELAIADVTQYGFRDSWHYHHTRGIAYAAIGEHDKAIADFKSALEMEPDVPEYEQEMRDYLA